MTARHFLPGRRWLVVAMLVGTGAATAQSPAPPQPEPGAVETGQRLFAANCARCHGATAQGTAAGPDLLSRVRGMSRDRFAEAVLRRYSWSVPAGEAAGEGALREAMLRGLLQRNAQPRSGAMPAWEGVTTVRLEVDKLFGYLETRATQAAPPRAP